MARKKVEDDDGGYSWMDTYGDMVTLLLTFFIMLFSMSSVDKEKFDILIQAFSRNPPEQVQQIVMPEGTSEGDQMVDAEGEHDLMVNDEIDLEHERPVSMTELYDFLKQYIEQNGMEGSVSIEKDALDNVYLRFDNNIFFAGDSSVLKSDSYPLLTFMGECFKSVEDKISVIQVEGHTATVAVDNYPVNDWTLSSDRANGVVNFFESESSFDPSKMTAIGYGKNRPRYANDTDEGRAKNRRVEIIVLGNEISAGDSEQLYSILQKMLGGETLSDGNETADIGGPPPRPNSPPELDSAQTDTDAATAQDVPSQSSGTSAAPGTEPQLPSDGATADTEPTDATDTAGAGGSAPASVTEPAP